MRRREGGGGAPSLSSPRRRRSSRTKAAASEELDPRLRGDDSLEEKKLPPGASLMEQVAQRGQDHIDAFLRALDAKMLDAAERSWTPWGRMTQQPPKDWGWRTWLILAGRGFGKTRAGAEWVRAIAENDGRARIALVGATMSEVRAVMVEGDSGLLAISPMDQRPLYEPSLGRLTWPSGAAAWLYSAAEPDGLRGPQHSHAWGDEIAKWPDGIRAWDMLAMTMRVGKRPRRVATTTPRPVPLVQRLLDDPKGDVVVTRGRTHENAGHLAPDFLDAMDAHYAGTRIGRQEIDGEYIEAIEGALWTRELIEERRVAAMPCARKRVVIGVDPPAGAGAGADACGIVVVALGEDEKAYVIADESVQGCSPEGWARAVRQAADRHAAARVIAEANNGGAMVESVLRAAGAKHLPVKLAHAAIGKAARAEPVSTLYERGVAFHVGIWRALEDELAGMVIGGDYCGPGRSPDRADALVWAMTELMLAPDRTEPRVRGL